MTATCMGNFGTYQYMYNRNTEEQPKQLSSSTNDRNTVWVTKRYIPLDLRVTAPVPKHKPVVPDAEQLPAPPSHWVPRQLETPGSAHIRERDRVCPSMPSTRCEDWSTLRQMLPSRGRPHSMVPPNWGTGLGNPPSMSAQFQDRFPHINSPMTR